MPTNRKNCAARSTYRHSRKRTLASCEIQTFGRVLENGRVIEPVRPESAEGVRLLFYDGSNQQIATRVRIGKKVYVPTEGYDSIVANISLPPATRSYGSVSELIKNLVDQIGHFSGLPPEYCGLVARFVLCTWIVEKLPSCPRLHLMGPRSRSETQLMRLLKSLCRHALNLAKVDATLVGSLPPEVCSTLVIHQRQFSKSSQQMLDACTDRVGIITPGGRYVRSEFAAVTCSDRVDDVPEAAVSLPIPMSLANSNCPLLSWEEQGKIADEFQGQLLQYRFDVFLESSASPLHSSELTFPARELEQCLAAATPQDPGLQAELRPLLENVERNFRLARSTSLDAMLVEALLFLCHDKEGQKIHVEEIAETLNGLRTGRAEKYEINSRAVGPRLRSIGIQTLQRDSRGIPVVLTNDVNLLVHKLARSFEVPSADTGRNCMLCASQQV